MAEADCENLICIAGSGERLIGLLDGERLRKVWAVDINPEALFLTELKIEALKHLEPAEYLAFVQGGSPQIMSHYLEFRSNLSAACRYYWDDRPKLLLRGILYAGAFERFLSRIRPVLRTWLGAGFLERLQAVEGTYRKSFPYLRWKLLRWFFSKRWVYWLWGNRDMAFIGNGACLSVIPDALHRSIMARNAQNSFMMQLIFEGHFDNMKEEALPPSMQLNVLEQIRSRLNSGQLSVAYIWGDWLEQCRLLTPVPGTVYSASDILSFVDLDYLEAFLALTYQRQKDAVVVVRAFVRHRISAETLQKMRTKWPFLQISECSEQESTGMYQVFTFKPVIKPK